MMFVLEVVSADSDHWSKRAFWNHRNDIEFQALWVLFCEGKSIVHQKEFTRARIAVHGNKQ